MESENTVDPLFLMGFNAGYLLSKYEPELLNKLTKTADQKSPYMQGLAYGQMQLEKEKTLENIKTKKNAQNKTLDR